jgi:hypothetical protein
MLGAKVYETEAEVKEALALGIPAERTVSQK